MDSLVIKDAFDTARLTAYYRALASEQPGARFQDPYARLLAGERGAEIMQGLPFGEAGRWAIMMRTCIYDEIILQRIKSEEIDTIINLGAGLDTRAYRLPLPASLRWIDVDYPDVLAYKKEALAHASPVCLYEHMPFSITDQEACKAFLATTGQESKQILVLTEGLLIYLTTEQVISLATSLWEQPAIHWWLTDLASSLSLERDEKVWNAMAAEAARTRFAPAGGLAFFQRCGWSAAEFRFPIREAVRFQVPLRRKWLARLFSLLLPTMPVASYRGSGFVLFKRGEQHFNALSKNDGEGS